MGIVASNKKVLEIIETYRHWQQPVGGRDEAHDATAAGSSGQNSSSVSTQPEERKEHDLERASGAHGIQSRLCQASTATTWSTTEAGETIVSSGCAPALKSVPCAVLQRAGESSADQDLESNGLHLRQAYATGVSRDGASVRAPQRTALRSRHQDEAATDQCGHHRSPTAP